MTGRSIEVLDASRQSVNRARRPSPPKSRKGLSTGRPRRSSSKANPRHLRPSRTSRGPGRIAGGLRRRPRPFGRGGQFGPSPRSSKTPNASPVRTVSERTDLENRVGSGFQRLATWSRENGSPFLKDRTEGGYSGSPRTNTRTPTSRTFAEGRGPVQGFQVREFRTPRPRLSTKSKSCPPQIKFSRRGVIVASPESSSG